MNSHAGGRTLCVLLSAAAISLAVGAVLYISKEYNRHPVRIGVVLPLSGEYKTCGMVTMREDHHMILNMIIAEFLQGKLTARKEPGPIVPENQIKAWRKDR